MSAEFDPKKDAANIKKHGVSLSEGDGVLNDPLALTVEDDLAEGEQRYHHRNERIRVADGRCSFLSRQWIANHLCAEGRPKRTEKL
ncbi:MAG: BrnT family toxin [Burkholderiales bacterium]|nr:BrnT family toxin [Burkholderiales bacterium]